MALNSNKVSVAFTVKRVFMNKVKLIPLAVYITSRYNHVTDFFTAKVKLLNGYFEIDLFSMKLISNTLMPQMMVC